MKEWDLSCLPCCGSECPTSCEECCSVYIVTVSGYSGTCGAYNPCFPEAPNGMTWSPEGECYWAYYESGNYRWYELACDSENYDDPMWKVVFRYDTPGHSRTCQVWTCPVSGPCPPVTSDGAVWTETLVGADYCHYTGFSLECGD